MSKQFVVNVAISKKQGGAKVYGPFKDEEVAQLFLEEALDDEKCASIQELASPETLGCFGFSQRQS
jgi:hypothetical protein